VRKEIKITRTRIIALSELRNGYATPIFSSPRSSSRLSICFCYPRLTVHTGTLTCGVFAGRTKIPNARRIDSLPRTCSYTTVCIYTSYIITPDGASTSRTLSKAPHDSVYLLNTEYNVSLAYTCTWTYIYAPVKETYPEGPFTMPHMAEMREVAQRGRQLNTMTIHA